MKPLNVLILTFSLSIALISACGNTIPNEPARPGLRSNPTGSMDISSTAIPTASMIRSPTVNGIPPAPNELVEKAREDLAQRLSVPVSQIDLVEAKEVVWSDASLGCPLPGMIYAQVQTAGYLIQLEANSEKYGYHTDLGNTVFLCEPASIENSSQKENEKNVEDGWPNQPKDKEMIKLTPTKRP
jgi:hypothetical protein